MFRSLGVCLFSLLLTPTLAGADPACRIADLTYEDGPWILFGSYRGGDSFLETTESGDWADAERHKVKSVEAARKLLEEIA